MTATTSKNEATKAQIRRWLERAVKKAQNPDPREKLKKERKKRAKEVAKRYGF